VKTPGRVGSRLSGGFMPPAVRTGRLRAA